MYVNGHLYYSPCVRAYPYHPRYFTASLVNQYETLFNINTVLIGSRKIIIITRDIEDTIYE